MHDAAHAAAAAAAAHAAAGPDFEAANLGRREPRGHREPRGPRGLPRGGSGPRANL